jgi:hypothetical protein
MRPFADVLRDWQMFYATVATACATLTGLLFVALTINLDILRRSENKHLVDTARLAFSQFILVLMVAIVFLIPHQSPVSLGVALIALSIAYAAATARYLARALSRNRHHKARRAFTPGALLSIVGYTGVLGVGIAVLLHWWFAFYLLVFMLAAALAAASRYAWFLLTKRADDSTDTLDPDAPAPSWPESNQAGAPKT